MNVTIGRRTIDCKIIMKKIGPIAEINSTRETGTTPKNIKETIHTVAIGHTVEIGLITETVIQ